jgi:uncharacterized protein
VKRPFESAPALRPTAPVLVAISFLEVLLLVGAGAVGGFLAGLVGVGGGIIYGPVLLYYFRAVGIEDPVLTPLTLGTSLLCVSAAAISGAVSQRGSGAIDWRVAVSTGVVASAITAITGALITTQPWYDRQAFQIVLGSILVWVVARMLIQKRRGGVTAEQVIGDPHRRHGLGVLAAIGAGVGVLVAAAGVGGGVLLVPLYSSVLKMPLKRAMATSLAGILVVSISGVITYVVLGLDADVPVGALGYVDFWRGALLGLPAIFLARLGVRTAQRVDVRLIRYTFAAVAAVVAMRLLYEGVLG